MKGLKTSEQRRPPYAPYATFKNFLLDHKQGGAPARVDNSILKHMGGTLRQQLIGTLKYLNLIDEQGIAQDPLKRLVKSEGADREDLLREILTEAYSWAFAGDGSYDFGTNATDSQLREKFEEAGATGDTVRKGIAFLLNACLDAKMEFSPHIHPPKKRSPSPRSSKQATGVKAKNPPSQPQKGEAAKTEKAAAPKGEEHPLFHALKADTLEEQIDELMFAIGAQPAAEKERLFKIVKKALRYAEVFGGGK